MSNLVLELKPGEIMLINGAAIRFRTRTRLELVSRARFLFGKQVMSADEARTPARRLYYTLQTGYVGAEDDRAAAIAAADALLDALEDDAPGEADLTAVRAIRAAIVAGDNYGALKLTRSLVARET